MKIAKMELRNKKSGFTIKPCEFAQINILKAEDQNDALAVFESILTLKKFALGLEENANLDNISRLYFFANHHEYLWFAKTTADENGQMLVDEEEIYNADNEIIATRGFAQAAIRGAELPEINVCRSLIDIFGIPEIEDIRKGLTNIYALSIASSADLAKLNDLPHGALALVDGSGLNENVDLSGVRSDVQILAVGSFTGGVEKTLTRKGQNIAIK